MENASDALVMAGQVLIFIIALTICISSFTTLRAEVNRIVGQDEVVKVAKGTNGYVNYIESRSNGSARVVGAETVISSMYRAIKENYVIYIKLKPENYNNIDGIVTVTNATKDVVINGTNVITNGDKIIKVTIGIDTNQYVDKVLREGFYNRIKDFNFNEYLGEYKNGSQVTIENKQTKRVITYVQTT